MPGGDGTGPDGRGGWCTPLWTSGVIPRPLGGFWGRGGRFRSARPPGSGGRGRGYMNMFYATGQPGWWRDLRNIATEGVEQKIASKEGDLTKKAEQEKKEEPLLEMKIEELSKAIERLKKVVLDIENQVSGGKK